MIKWMSYSEESFSIAQQQDKPVFLHLTAKWSCYCKNFEEDCLQSIDIVDFINEKFVPILVDVDDRPDINSFYQKASYIVGQGSGLPLNIFLTSEGKPFSFLGYVSKGKEHFKTMLEKTLELYNTSKEKIFRRAQNIMEAIKPSEILPGEIREEILQNPEEEIIREMDFENGGFKKIPKFPIFSHIDLLLWRYWIRPKPWIKEAIEKTLKGMVLGGIYDHIEGGFHRYCKDKAWYVPDFEKLAIDNAWHVINYLDAYTLLKDNFYREIALETIDYLIKFLYSPEEKIFYSSQHCDSFYYTWKEEELREISDMTIVLVDTEAMIDDRFILVGRDRNLINQIRKKLLIYRGNRKTPEIDKTHYCFVNGISSEALMKAYKVTGNKNFLHIAISALQNTINKLYINQKLYRRRDIEALLSDYSYLILSLISAYEITADEKYIEKAKEIMYLAISELWDEKYGGFYESSERVAAVKQKNIHDNFYPSSNSIMIINLLKLYAITEEKIFKSYAEKALKAFSNVASAYLSPFYVKATLAFFDLLTLKVYTPASSEIAKAAIKLNIPFTVLSYQKENKGFIIPSLESKKFEPIDSIEKLIEFLRAK
ncbi:MAG: DUF255 domain-containing protein [Thermodesulfovibrio sp.]|nr:DUF255 domain-containing protein [Thermodesulfovibrio sp.]